MDDLTNITLRWDDRNEIELAHRVYRSDTPFGETELPLPVARLPRKVSNFVDTVTAGKTYYYRVSAVGKNNEQLSNLTMVSARRNIHPHVLTNTTVSKLLQAGNIDLMTHDSHYYKLKVNYRNIVATTTESIDVIDVNGSLLRSIPIVTITDRPVIDIELSWDNTIVLVTEVGFIRLTVTGERIAEYTTSRMDGHACNIGAYAFTVIEDGYLHVLDYHFNTIDRFYVNHYTKPVCGMGVYAVYDTHGVVVFNNRVRHSVGGFQIRSVHFDENNHLTIIDRNTMVKYDTHMQLLHSYKSDSVITESYMDDHGNPYGMIDGNLTKIVLRANNSPTVWSLPSSRVAIDLPKDEVRTPAIFWNATYSPLSSVHIDTDPQNTEEVISSDRTMVSDDISYEPLTGITTLSFSSSDYDITPLTEQEVNTASTVNMFSTTYDTLRPPYVEGEQHDEAPLTVEFEALTSPDIEGEAS